MHSALKFRLLGERPDLCPVLAEWYQAEWPELFHPGATARDEAAGCLAMDGADCTIVLLEGDIPVAAASLLREDVLSFPASPWLGTVVVHPEHRGRGFGRAIVEEATRRAALFGIRTLHLWTPRHRTFYENLGWHHVGDFALHEGTVAILRLFLSEIPAACSDSQELK